MTEHLRLSGDWQTALSKATEELQRLPPLALKRSERQVARKYIWQMEKALNAIAGRCPDCHTCLGGHHYCGRHGYRTYDELGIPESDPRRDGAYFG